MGIKIFDYNLAKLMESSRASLRKRASISLHPPEKEGFRVGVNCIQLGSYVQPHMHPSENGDEMLIFICGGIYLITFTDSGKLEQSLLLSHFSNKLAEIPHGVYHTAISMEPNSIMYELSNGPYNKETYKQFASWAPEEGENERAQKYLQKLKDKLKLKN